MADSVVSLFVFLVVTGLVAVDGVKFNCSALPPLTQPARTVRELKPQDVKVVMALGDSITAGWQPSALSYGLHYSLCRVWDDGQPRNIRLGGLL